MQQCLKKKCVIVNEHMCSLNILEELSVFFWSLENPLLFQYIMDFLFFQLYYLA